MTKCENCVHNEMTGCRMLDCIHHPKSDKYSAEMDTNTFNDRFLDKNNLPYRKDK